MWRRLWVSVAIVGITVGGQLAGAEPPPPKTAYVQQAQVPVRSGPGDQFYATQLLSAGDEVRVYRYQGDWAAIRPPEGSFSWLPADHVTPTDSYDVAKICDGPVKTRVGSHLSDERYVAYVTLETGERVQLLASEDSDEEWLRIAPPAGEFRWIHCRDLGDEAPLDEMYAAEANGPDEYEVVRGGDSSPLPSASGIGTHRSRPENRAASAEAAALETSLQESLGNLRRAIHAILPEQSSADSRSAASRPAPVHGASPATDELPAGAVMLASGESPWQEEAGEEAITAPASGADSPGLARGDGPPLQSDAASPTLSAELIRLAADLSQAVSEPPETWQLAPLRRRTQAVIDASGAPEIRDEGLQLLARIAQFEDLQRRHRQLARQPASLASNWANAVARLGGSRSGSSDTLPPVDVRQYDGHGWLMPVASQNQRAPRYVLTDDQGNILQFVTPSPGMNLRRYERKQVGVYGQRGFLPSLQQPHLVAERVVSLDALR